MSTTLKSRSKSSMRKKLSSKSQRSASFRDRSDSASTGDFSERSSSLSREDTLSPIKKAVGIVLEDGFYAPVNASGQLWSPDDIGILNLYEKYHDCSTARRNTLQASSSVFFKKKAAVKQILPRRFVSQLAAGGIAILAGVSRPLALGEAGSCEIYILLASRET
eukprot:714369_1